MQYFASSEDTLYIVTTVILIFLLLGLIGAAIAALIITNKIKKKVDAVMAAPRKGKAFINAFSKSFKKSSR